MRSLQMRGNVLVSIRFYWKDFISKSAGEVYLVSNVVVNIIRWWLLVTIVNNELLLSVELTQAIITFIRYSEAELPLDFNIITLSVMNIHDQKDFLVYKYSPSFLIRDLMK